MCNFTFKSLDITVTGCNGFIVKYNLAGKLIKSIDRHYCGPYFGPYDVVLTGINWKGGLK